MAYHLCNPTTLQGPGESPRLCRDVRKSEPASPPCRARIYSKPRLLPGQCGCQSYDLSWSRPFARLCRGRSPVKVERPFKRQPQIAKTTLVCAALIILGCGGPGPFSPQTETRKHVNNFVRSRSCTDPQSSLARTVREPLELSRLVAGIPVRGPWLLYQP